MAGQPYYLCPTRSPDLAQFCKAICHHVLNEQLEQQIDSFYQSVRAKRISETSGYSRKGMSNAYYCSMQRRLNFVSKLYIVLCIDILTALLCFAIYAPLPCIEMLTINEGLDSLISPLSYGLLFYFVLNSKLWVLAMESMC